MLCSFCFIGLHSKAFAYHAFTNFGIADEDGKQEKRIQSVSLGLQNDLNKYFLHQATAFYMRDLANTPHYYTFGGWYSLGMETNFDFAHIQMFWGAGGITNPDSHYLGGVFQFLYQFNVFFEDKIGRGIGFTYEHISSAGIYTANVGRDFLLFRASINLDKDTPPALKVNVDSLDKK